MPHQTIKHCRKTSPEPTMLKWTFGRKKRRFSTKFSARESTTREYGRRASTELVSLHYNIVHFSAPVITFIKTQFSSRNAIGRQCFFIVAPLSHMIKYRKYFPFSVLRPHFSLSLSSRSYFHHHPRRAHSHSSHSENKYTVFDWNKLLEI